MTKKVCCDIWLGSTSPEYIHLDFTVNKFERFKQTKWQVFEIILPYKKTIMEKTIFITGASSGLGKATAILFAKNNWKVIASMRSPEKSSDFGDYENISIVKLDITNKEQINKVVKEVTKSGVDVVFNNAGVGLMGPLETYSEQQITDQFATNVFGVIHLIQAFIPFFRENRKGLFITTTSISGRIAFPFNSIYSSAKWALEGFSESLSYELGAFGVGVKTISPGGIKSSFGTALSISTTDKYKATFEKFMNAMMSGKTPTIASEPEVIAEVVYEAATDGKSKLRYAAGVDAVQYTNEKAEMGEEAYREHLEKVFLS